MERWFRPTKNPALIARCERRRREIEMRLGDARVPRTSDTRGLALPASELVRRALACGASSEQRWQRALTLLLEHARGTHGCLASHSAGRLQCLAEVGRGALTEQEQARLLAAIARHESSDRDATVAMSIPSSSDLTTAKRSGTDGLGAHPAADHAR